MEKTERIGRTDCRVIRCGTAVVGTGAAGYNAADRLYQLGGKDIVLVTENRLSGTSRNTGSDKQTYYKLTLSGGEPDSVREMAETLFGGQCVDGDLALCEAALSAQGFLRLVELGVPFPKNRYGEYIGYKTDHDPRRRATSVGPYTSRIMTEKLEQAVLLKKIPLLDHTQVIRILSDGAKVYGLVCLCTGSSEADSRFLVILCENIIYAVGGPAGMYKNSVYPVSQSGASGLAFEAGVRGRNLTEWQYGLASVKPRWNVSGTYMQVLPRVCSAEADGTDEREFLMDFFQNVPEMLSLLFLKGYQWPFDVRKVEGGSSVIDILVYLESCKGRKVYLDFRKNPADGAFSFDELEPEAREYLKKAGACFGTPIERLRHMNSPAIDFYLDKGVDLAAEPLEIALCAQHNNGGLAVDCWWQTNLEGFFAAGEAAGSHGVYRPGGSALNAGQVGSTRAAQYIAACRKGSCDERTGLRLAEEALNSLGKMAEAVLAEPAPDALRRADDLSRGDDRLRRDDLSRGDGMCQSDDPSRNHESTSYRRDARKVLSEIASDMSVCGAAFRDVRRIERQIRKDKELLGTLTDTVCVKNRKELGWFFRLRDVLISQIMYLSAMKDYAEHGGKSRGSALYTDLENGRKPYPELPEEFTFTLDDGSRGNLIQEISWNDGECGALWRTVRPIPEDDDFFENVWRTYRENGNVY
ncbi:MAG: FAD-binding protein [Lachnospiraceae bacterium]|nr:FAD-binding protein [Lachnospiraceae bacterium]